MAYTFWGLGGKFLGRLKSFLEQKKVTRFLTLTLILLACIAGGATYYAFSQTGFGAVDSTSLILLLNVDLVILLSLTLVIAKQLARVWNAKRSGKAAAKLHTRFVVLFSLLTITPAVVMTVFSALMFNMGLQQWFSDRVSTALEESTKVAEAYLDEHKKVISASVYTMARDLAQEFRVLQQNPAMFNQALDLHAETRNLDEALVFNGTPEVIGRSKLSFALEFEVLSVQELEEARTGVVIKTNGTGGRVRALTKISPDIDAYLLVGRIVDPAVSKRIAEVKDAVSTYHALEQDQQTVQLYFFLMFMLVAFLLLLTAVWIALSFAGRIAGPIGSLISASEKVRKGDLTVRLSPSQDDDEIALLMRSFNKMTGQLDEQQTALVKANSLLDSRRRFIEDVLAGVTSGVISIDDDKVIRTINVAAALMLGTDREKAVSKKIQTIFGELSDLFTELEENNMPRLMRQVKSPRKGAIHTFLVQIVRPEADAKDPDQMRGYIITFDDITELLGAQRKAAWADVARRIAHEIRNPLTPIQLSAERLNRKYSKQISEDKESFENCVDTIIRQVTHIGDMVREFSNFARLPEPKFAQEDLLKLIKQHVEQYKHTRADITFSCKATGMKDFPFSCDAAQMSQVFTNLLQNSIDSIDESCVKAKDKVGKITIILEPFDQGVEVIVKDNGMGFPKENREVLTDPYITKKEKGTGLGLAVVKKIIEDHNGTLTLEDASRGGAIVRIRFRVEEKQEQTRQTAHGT